MALDNPYGEWVLIWAKGADSERIVIKRDHRITRTPAILSAASRFSPEDYLKMYPDVAAAGVDPTRHYEEFGRTEMRDPNVLFDEMFYRAIHIDVRDAIVFARSLASAFEHFRAYGINESRTIYTRFDEPKYLKANPDVLRAVMIDRSFSSGLEHYALHGRSEGRAMPLKTGRTGY